MRKLSKVEWVAVAVAVALSGYTLFGNQIIGLFQKTPMNDDSLAAAGAPQAQSGVVISDVTVGNGPEVKMGDVVSVNYVLSLADGTIIQKSKDFGQPFKFVLGAGEVIPGWEQGFVGMKVGGVRNITIPPELGYGQTQNGPIPPNSTLVFNIELLDASPAPTTGPVQQ